jgi:hypothetical protein
MGSNWCECPVTRETERNKTTYQFQELPSVGHVFVLQYLDTVHVDFSDCQIFKIEALAPSSSVSA